MRIVLYALLFISALYAATPTPLEKGDEAYLKKDYQSALAWYQKSADANDSRAIHQMGIMYETEKGVKRDYLKATDLYKKAVKMGNLDAYFNLARIYENGLGTPRDLNTSIQYYTYTADRGHTRAQHNLAHLYDDTTSPYHDDAKAFHYYKLAAEKAFTLSEYGLANHYATGAGCEKDEPKAVELYKKVLLKGDDARAQYNVALMIARGQGHPKNNTLAYALWENNAAFGSADSAYNRDILKKRISPEEISEGEKLSKDRKKMIESISPLKKLLTTEK